MMDDKTITAVATTFALFQIQLNALLLLMQQQHPAHPIREEFQRLTNEGVQAAGLETMKGLKKQLLDAIAQQQKPEPSNGDGQA
jgi:hypothetical protein